MNEVRKTPTQGPVRKAWIAPILEEYDVGAVTADGNAAIPVDGADFS